MSDNELTDGDYMMLKALIDSTITMGKDKFGDHITLSEFWTSLKTGIEADLPEVDRRLLVVQHKLHNKSN